MGQGSKSKQKSKVSGNQSSQRPKHRAPSSSLLDLNSSSDEQPTPAVPNKRTKSNDQLTMDIDKEETQQTSTITAQPVTEEIISPTLETTISHESATSSIL